MLSAAETPPIFNLFLDSDSFVDIHFFEKDHTFSNHMVNNGSGNVPYYRPDFIVTYL